MSFSTDKFYVSHFTSKDNLEYILESMSLQPLSLQEQLFKHKNPDKEFANTYYYETSEDQGDPEKYKRSIFYSILFPDNDGIPIFNPPEPGKEAFFIFSPKIVSDNNSMVGNYNIQEGPIFCKGWHFGKTSSEKCIHYDNSKSLEENLNSWRTYVAPMIQVYHENNKEFTSGIMGVQSGALGTELLLEGEMPIELDLVHIYVPPQTLQIQMMEGMVKINPKFQKAVDLMNQEEEEVEKLMKEFDYLPWTRENPFK
jgi:hypothetical protein